MAKIIITLEDLPEGKIKIVTEPPLKQIIEMDISGHSISPALGMAFKVLNDIRKESKNKGPIIVQIPKLIS